MKTKIFFQYELARRFKTVGDMVMTPPSIEELRRGFRDYEKVLQDMPDHCLNSDAVFMKKNYRHFDDLHIVRVDPADADIDGEEFILYQLVTAYTHSK